LPERLLLLAKNAPPERHGKSLAAALFSDPERVRVQSAQLRQGDRGTLRNSDLMLLRSPSPDIGSLYFRDAPRALAAVTHVPNPAAVTRARSAVSFIVHFEADWIEPRGFKTCWLALPQTVGPGPAKVSSSAGPSINHLVRGDTSDIITESATGFTPKTGPPIYIPTRLEPLNVAMSTSITFGGALRLLDSQSQAPPPLPGPPRWECRVSARDLHDARDIPTPSGDPGEKPISMTPASSCSGWVALSEPGASSWRDLGLIMIGLLFSLSASLFLQPARSQGS
jgi:hypothetical protein